MKYIIRVLAITFIYSAPLFAQEGPYLPNPYGIKCKIKDVAAAENYYNSVMVKKLLTSFAYIGVTLTQDPVLDIKIDADCTFSSKYTLNNCISMRDAYVTTTTGQTLVIQLHNQAVWSESAVTDAIINPDGSVSSGGKCTYSSYLVTKAQNFDTGISVLNWVQIQDSLSESF